MEIKKQDLKMKRPHYFCSLLHFIFKHIYRMLKYIIKTLLPVHFISFHTGRLKKQNDRSRFFSDTKIFLEQYNFYVSLFPFPQNFRSKDSRKYSLAPHSLAFLYLFHNIHKKQEKQSAYIYIYIWERTSLSSVDIEVFDL